MATRSLKDGPGFVLRRGMAEYEWYTPSVDAAAQPAPGPGLQLPRVEWPAWRPQPWLKRVMLVALVLAGFWTLLMTFQAAFKGFQANGVSMEPTLHNGDRIIVNKIAYAQVDLGLLDWLPLLDPSVRWNSPSRGDVVVFPSPEHPARELIKRVVGLPGETVEIEHGLVYVNGAPLEEPYATGKTVCSGECLWVIPPGRYFVLGDNRENSSDSRDGWTVSLDQIDGKQVLSY